MAEQFSFLAFVSMSHYGIRPSRITARWQGLFVFQPESPNTVLIASAFDSRFQKHKFLPADEAFKVQSTVQDLALVAKKEAMPNESEN